MEASKKKYIDCIIKELGSRTKNMNKILKCFDVTHKSLTDAKVQERLRKLRTFLPNLDVESCILEHKELKLAMKDTQHTILSQVQYMYRNHGYKSLRPVYVLALCLPLDNAACERGFSVMNEIKTAKRNRLEKPLLPLTFIAIYKDFKYNFAKLGCLIADTWIRN